MDTKLDQVPVKERQFLQITCPIHECRQRLTLTCPHCHEGALTTKLGSGTLQCDTCGAQMSGVTCGCGHVVNTSVIRSMEEKLLRLRQQADPNSYFPVFYICGGAALMYVIGMLL